MSISEIIILAIAIVLAVVVIRFVTKILVKIIAIVLIVAAIGYFLFFFNGGIIDFPSSDKYVIEQLKETYCFEKADTAICDCVISFIMDDINSTYTPEEIMKLKDDQTKAIEAIVKSYSENRFEINDCLKQYNRGYSLEEFRNDLKALDLSTKFNNLVEKITSELENGSK